MYASTINKEGEIFTASTNGGKKNWTTADGEVINYGAWLRLSPNNGKIIWERPTPDHTTCNAALSSTNDIVFGQTAGGRMVALNAQCGNIEWWF